MIVGLSRSELLDWINRDFEAGYSNIEQCGSGAVYCQIFDSIYPGRIPVGKIHFEPRQDYQILSNYKLLQMGFNKVGLTREVPVERLMKFRMQDNLEFLQWFCKLQANAQRHGISNVSSVPSRKPLASSHINRPINHARVTPARSISGRSMPSRSIHKELGSHSRNFSGEPTVKHSNGLNITKSESTVYTPRRAISGETGKLSEAAETQESLEYERNFYFSKLRQIEIICQNLNDKIQQDKDSIDITVPELVQHVQEILYSMVEGFEVPDDNETGSEAGDFNDSGILSGSPLNQSPLSNSLSGTPEHSAHAGIPDSVDAYNDNSFTNKSGAEDPDALKILEEETF
ncbi:hypothetical protein HII12_002975 [Brettanomyces bruxellensis]|uniref:Uncharacterized protein n=1 Tax=Dekkera bruxellensis TaxID=5007 RepID=A0A8H6ETX2_DEKBR|nr:hypothetical protein HII12_002975 [Brettanomyces bruxellensis]